jgi:hypothetical protein
MRRSGVVINMVGTLLTRRMQLDLFMHEERQSIVQPAYVEDDDDDDSSSTLIWLVGGAGG